MKPTVHLARVSGIPIGAHWSALATAGLLAYLLAGSVLPDARPGEAGWVYWAAGLAGAALFLLTLRTDVLVAPAWLSVSRFLATIDGSRDLAFPVVDFDGRPVGLVSLARLAAVRPAYRDEITVGRLCVPAARLVTVAPGDVLAEVLTAPLAAGTAGTYLVVEGGRLVGVLDERDVTRAVALATPPPAGQDHAPMRG
jgi:CBS domain-containing protein